MNRSTVRFSAVGMLALVAGLVLPLLTAPAAVAVGFTVAPGVTMNDPLGGSEARWRILHKIEAAIDHTCEPSCEPGAPQTILISTYLMDRQVDYNKVIAAHERGASVQMLMDSAIVSEQSNHLVDVFGSPDKDGNGEVNDADGIDRTCDGKVDQADSTVKVEDFVPTEACPAMAPVQWSYAVKCVDSCRGGRGNNHVKFYAFSRTGDSSDVVMVSSANINRGGAASGWNDMYTMVGDRPTFDFYARVHHDMAEDDPSGNDCSKGTLERCAFKEWTGGNVVHRVFPKPNGTDPSMDQLDKVRCRGATDGAGQDGRTVIKIAMFWWSGTRGVALARKVIDLDRAGCDVQINYGAPSGEVSRLLRDSAHRGGVKLWDSRQLKGDDGRPTLRVHHKYMIINGSYGGSTTAYKVCSGTQNWINGALRQSDENTLEIDGRSTYSAYSAGFESIKKYARRIG